jgi:hypothetical protein
MNSIEERQQMHEKLSDEEKRAGSSRIPRESSVE